MPDVFVSVGQPPQGLIVDTEVISPLYPNFYLQSHAGMLGSKSPVSLDFRCVTSIFFPARKSSHYTILHNENESFDADL